MTGKRPDSSSLAEPQEALGFYLDSLLMDLPAEVAPEDPVEPSTDVSTSSAAFPVSESSSGPPPVVTAMSRRPVAEPERTMPLFAGRPLLPRLLTARLGAGTVSDDMQNDRQAVPPVVPVPSLPAEPIPPVEEAPAAVPDRQSTFRGVPEASPDACIDEPVAESRRRTEIKAGAPSWAGGRFQCLTFMVAGLTLAAPLERLHGIVEWPGELTGLPGYADWFMGLLPSRGQNVRVIDTAQIIMPDGRIPDARPVLERVQYVVLIDEGRWGLAADAIAQIVTLSADGVRWRGEGGRRPWLAGTAVEQMCAVLDMDNLSAQLAEGLKLDG